METFLELLLLTLNLYINIYLEYDVSFYFNDFSL